jgi:hypothetical protein
MELALTVTLVVFAVLAVVGLVGFLIDRGEARREGQLRGADGCPGS